MKSKHLMPAIVVVLAGMSILRLEAAQAVIIQTNESNSDQEFFAASATDLINQGQPSLLSSSITNYASAGGVYGSVDVLNNGIIGPSSSDTVFGAAAEATRDEDNSYETTFELDLTNAPLGYKISSSQSFVAWQDTRNNQAYELSVSFINDVSFSSLGTYTFDPLAAGSTRITLTDTSGFLAIGVDAVRFTIIDNSPSTSAPYREFDVFGSAVVIPEPSSLVLLAFGAGFAGVRGRRRRAK